MNGYDDRDVCSFEPEIIDASRRGTLDDEQRNHLIGCEECREALQVAALLQDAAETPGVEPELPQAPYFWWKSQIQERLAFQKRRRRSLGIFQALVIGLTLVLSVAALFLLWPILGSWVGPLVPEEIQKVAAASPSIVTLLSLASAVVLVVALAVHALLADD